jgi:hypothetical protein
MRKCLKAVSEKECAREHIGKKRDGAVVSEASASCGTRLHSMLGIMREA